MIHLTETDSTINHLSRLSSTGPVEELTVVRADFQTAGKGQRGNSWESESRKNLLFSILFYPTFLEIRNQFLLSKLVALAVKEALDPYAEGFSIKWPNDIYWKNRKICGMLIENDLIGSTLQKSIAGIGINVNQQVFHSNAPNPVSLWQITQREHSVSELLEEVTKRIHSYYAMLQKGEAKEISRRYHDSLYRKEGYHLYRDASGEFRARIREVEPAGFLVLEDQEGEERRYAFKEVGYVDE